MLQQITDLPQGVEGVQATGWLSKEDYERVIKPMLSSATQQHDRMRLLFQMGPGFRGLSPEAAWEDIKLSFTATSRFDACAVVSNAEWLREAVRVVGFFMPCPVRSFSLAQRREAIHWLETLPEAAATSHHVLPDQGVLVVEIHEALRPRDFEELSRTADAWVRDHGELQGLVVHTKKFPGWENLESLFRHVRFVRNHQHHIRRVALSTDSALANVAPKVAGFFVDPEIEKFPYDALASSIAWAAGEHAGADSGMVHHGSTAVQA
jgi:hypothetical protein